MASPTPPARPFDPGPVPAAGLYRPEDWIWRVNRERVLLLAGPRALLMQLAHPLVAEAVDRHSDFPADALGRLRRTLDAMLGILFGDGAEARGHARRVAAAHAPVQGRLRAGAGSWPAGTPYRAFDPDLLFWVQATLNDSAVAAYEAFVAPLDSGAREALYRESKRMAPLFGLAEEGLPESARDFRRAVEEWIAGPRLAIGEPARRLADAVLHPPLPGVPRGLFVWAAPLSLGLLPPPLRERFGFAWTDAQDRRFARLRAGVRRVRPLLPPALSVVPQARRGEARWARRS